MTYAEIRFKDAQWATTFDDESTTPEYRAFQFAFEAAAAARRANV